MELLGRKRNLNERFLFKMRCLIFIWNLCCFGILPVKSASRQNLFTRVKGCCFSTDVLSSYHVDSLTECGQRSAATETCVGFQYRSSLDEIPNCKTFKKMENCSQCSNKHEAWIFYKAINKKPIHRTKGYLRHNDLAQSCLDYLKMGYKTNGHYRINESGLSYMVYCDMESQPNSAWTLVESFALKNRDTPAFSKHPLKTDAPEQSEAPNWSSYRMSFSQMYQLQAQSTHWRVTCDFQTNPVDLHRDYTIATFKDFDVLSFTGTDVCKKMQYIDIRGHNCSECTAGWWAILNKNSVHVDSSRDHCQLKTKDGAVNSEDNFGLYAITNNKFRCTSTADATTNIWFGGSL